jgi:galactokinase
VRAISGPDGAPGISLQFERIYGRTADSAWAAPGRVNLIGEHTDYNDGLVLPFAIEQRVYTYAAPGEAGRLRARSMQADGVLDVMLADLEPATPMPRWARYVSGVAWALRETGFPVRGTDLLVDGQVPLGGGLSSSHALQCSVALALTEQSLAAGAAAERPPRKDLAVVVQRSENDFVGAPTGLMDQMASLLCEAGHALLLDVRSLDTRQVPFAPSTAGLRLLVIDTHVRHTHAGGEYAERRRSCEEATARLGVPSLRDASAELVASGLAGEPLLLRRARHVVTENARVQAAVAALDAGDWARLGELMTASHASMRDDYEISCAELDAAVDASLGAGALGARMTGGGFGGSAITLVPEDRLPAVHRAVREAFDGKGWQEPGFMVAEPAAGAGPAPTGT